VKSIDFTSAAFLKGPGVTWTLQGALAHGVLMYQGLIQGATAGNPGTGEPVGSPGRQAETLCANP
jgi:hypothetical protein